MYLPREIVQALPPEFANDSATHHIRLDGDGRSALRTLHVVANPDHVVWLGQRGFLDTPTPLTFTTPPAITGKDWDRRLQVTTPDGETHAFRVPSFDAETLEKLVNQPQTRPKSPANAAPTPAPVSHSKPPPTSSASNLSSPSPSFTLAAKPVPATRPITPVSRPQPTSRTATSPVASTPPATVSALLAASPHSGEAHQQVAAAVVAGNFRAARQGLASLVAGLRNPVAAEGQAQYLSVFAELEAGRPLDALARCAMVCRENCEIDPELWIEQACIHAALLAFSSRGEVWGQGLAYKMGTETAPAGPWPGLPTAPWRKLLQWQETTQAWARRDHGYRANLGAFLGLSPPKIDDDNPLKLLEYTWAAYSERWLANQHTADPQDLQILVATIAFVASPLRDDVDAPRLRNLFDQLRQRDPSHLRIITDCLEARGAWRELGYSFDELQAMRRTLVATHAEHLSEYDEGDLTTIADAALFVDNIAVAQQCCAYMKNRGQRWLAGTFGEYVDVDQLLNLARNGDVVPAAELVLCDSDSAVKHHELAGLCWWLSQQLERSGSVQHAAAILTPITDLHPEILAAAQRLAARANCNDPDAAASACRKQLRAAAAAASTPNAHLGRTLLALHNGPKHRTVSLARQFVEAAPGDIQALCLLAYAIEQLQEELGDPPAPSNPNFAAAVEARQVLAQAVDNALKTTPGEACLWTICAEHHINLERRIAAAEVVLGLHPHDYEVREKLALAALSLGQLATLRTAVTTLAGTVAAWDLDHAAKLEQAEALLSGDDPSPAILAMVRAYILDEDDDDDADDDADDDDDDNTATFEDEDADDPYFNTVASQIAPPPPPPMLRDPFDAIPDPPPEPPKSSFNPIWVILGVLFGMQFLGAMCR